MQVTTASLGWFLVAQFVLYGLTWFACGQVVTEERGAARAFGGFIVCVAAGMALSSLRDTHPGWVSGVLSMLVYQAAFLLLWRGSAAFTHQAQQTRLQLAVFASAALATVGLGPAAQTGPYRVLVTNLCMLAAIVLCSRQIYKPIQNHFGRHGLWALALPTVSICALFVARIVQQALNLQHSYEIHQAGSWNAQMMMGFLVVAGLFNLSFFGLVVMRLVRRLHALTHRDPLTGLHNRRALETELQREWHKRKRSGRDMAVLAIDLDHFKRFNDTHGHLVGDRVLVAAAQALRAGARQTDLVARSGGEEFVAVLSDTSPQAALASAQRLLRDVAALRLPCEQGELRLTTSIGLALAGPQDASPTHLLERADRALYEAKRLGRNRVASEDIACEDLAPPR